MHFEDSLSSAVGMETFRCFSVSQVGKSCRKSDRQSSDEKSGLMMCIQTSSQQQ